MHKFSAAADEIIRRAAPPVLRDPQAGAPGLLNGPEPNERHDLYPCGFGFAILTVRASHRLAPTPLRYKNLCIIRAKKKEEVPYPVFLPLLPLRNQPDNYSYGHGNTGDPKPNGEQ